MFQVLCERCLDSHDLVRGSETPPPRCPSCRATDSWIGPYVAEARITGREAGRISRSPHYAVAFTDRAHQSL